MTRAVVWLRAALRELFALFVDDAAFSAAIIGWVAAIAVAGLALPGEEGWKAPGFFLGCAAILVVGTRRSARRHFAVLRRAAPGSAAGKGQDGR